MSLKVIQLYPEYSFLLFSFLYLIIYEKGLFLLILGLSPIQEDFHGSSVGKKICWQCRRPRFNPWVGKILWRRKWQPTPVFLSGKSHGQRRLVGLQSMGSQKLDTTWQLNHHHLFRHLHYLLNVTWKMGKRKENRLWSYCAEMYNSKGRSQDF